MDEKLIIRKLKEMRSLLDYDEAGECDEDCYNCPFVHPSDGNGKGICGLGNILNEILEIVPYTSEDNIDKKEEI